MNRMTGSSAMIRSAQVVAAIALLAALPALAADTTVLTCVSTDGARHHCAGYTMAGVALESSTGTAACLLGRNWGYDAEGVWVTEGCGGQFVLGNPQAEKERVAARSPDEGAAAVPDGQPGDRARLGGYQAYSRFGTQIAAAEGDAEVQDASSRMGLRYEYDGPVRFFAGAEWAVNLTGKRNAFNPGESTNGEIIRLDVTRDDLFGNRLGYAGVDFGDYGRLTLGKQWGVHYDVTSYTDSFNVFGADASATFNAGTDGGLMGTGRADSALSYRNTFFDIFDLGLQVQMRGALGGDVIDGFGGSLQARVLPDLKIGMSYTRARYDDSIKNRLRGLRGDAEYGAFGIRYESDRLSLAGVLARQRNGDLARLKVYSGNQLIEIPEVFDASGVELFGRYQVGRFGVLGGYLNYRPDVRAGSLLLPGAELEYVVGGIDYVASPKALLFAEYRLARGVEFSGEPGEDVFAMGFKFSFLKTGGFYLD